MRHFLAYHNAQKMGYSCTVITVPRVKTSKSVTGLEGSTVWLVAGEGKRPKSYYLASRFVIEQCSPDKHAGSELPNEVSGAGNLFGTRMPLDGMPILEKLRRVSANFVNGFFELQDPSVVSALKAFE